MGSLRSAPGVHTPPVADPPFSDMLISARSFAEYRDMFGLDERELSAGPILDCPAGAASFVAAARAQGVAVVGCDPAYALTRGQLSQAARRSVDRASRYSIDHPEHFVWDWFESTDHHRAVRSEACETFVSDFERRPGWYAAGSLPWLPFADRTFALTLSSHLLFVWTDRFDYAFHRRAIAEMVRVTSGEVRVFPVIDPDTTRYPRLDELRDDLAETGIETEIRRVDYVVQVGGGELLVCSRR
jgi:hypothetical protein